MQYNCRMANQPPRFLLRFDGSSRNPGPSGIGYTLAPVGSSVGGQGIDGANNTGPTTLVRVGAQIGYATNNEAEYQALINGLRHAIRLGMWRVGVESDSMLVVMQMKGKWKVRDSWLKRLNGEAQALRHVLSSFGIEHIRREENAEADELSRGSVFEEPPLPPLLPVLGRQRSLYEWQAAFIRYHWRAGVRNSYFWGRIFDVDPPLIEHIGNNETYKNARFVGMPAWAYMAYQPAALPGTEDETAQDFGFPDATYAVPADWPVSANPPNHPEL